MKPCLQHGKNIEATEKYTRYWTKLSKTHKIWFAPVWIYSRYILCVLFAWQGCPVEYQVSVLTPSWYNIKGKGGPDYCSILSQPSLTHIWMCILSLAKTAYIYSLLWHKSREACFKETLSSDSVITKIFWALPDIHSQSMTNIQLSHVVNKRPLLDIYKRPLLDILKSLSGMYGIFRIHCKCRW